MYHENPKANTWSVRRNTIPPIRPAIKIQGGARPGRSPFSGCARVRSATRIGGDCF